jgi:hypothetical protein
MTRRVLAVVLMLTLATGGIPILAAPGDGPEQRIVAPAQFSLRDAERVMRDRGWTPTGRSVTFDLSGDVPMPALGPILAPVMTLAQTGRWKWSGSSCYWAANDSGPHQCDPNAKPKPTGRYKWSGIACYWDANDSGPNQCNPALAPNPNAVLNDNAIVGTWTAWDDGNPYTWEGTIVITGPMLDRLEVMQQVDFRDYANPVVLWTSEVRYLDTFYATGRTCPTCPKTGQARAVKRYPFWKEYYKCAATGCAISAILAFLPFVGAAAFFTGCTAQLLTCMSGRLWEWDTMPPELQ